VVKHKDESIFIDFEYTDGEIPDGYYAKYYIQTDEILKEDFLEKIGDKFLLRIESGELNEINLPKVKLKVAVINDDIGYKDYIFEEDIILK